MQSEPALIQYEMSQSLSY